MPTYATGEVARVGDIVRGTVDGAVKAGIVLEVQETDASNVKAAIDGKPAQLSNGTVVLDDAQVRTLTAAELEKIDGLPAVEDAAGSTGAPDAANASGVAEEVGSGG